MSKEPIPFDDWRQVEPWFWDIIDRAGKSPERLRELLATLNRDELERFDSQSEWARAGLSDDDFRAVHGYTRDDMQELAAWIASQGRAYYRQVFDDPKHLPRLEDIDEQTNFDGVVGAVYQERFNEDMPYTG
ncbi:MAG: DUF4240 domain-containing protein [Gemmataceae bacterium]|nr:DUF4240 domain-containing protein [Gemmataceae bacterium]